MKFPFEFSTKLIFRLLFPGAILAAAMAPLVHAVLHVTGILINIKYLFPFEVVGWGWAIIICDMRIYMLFEGRRYWPSRIRRWLVCRQKVRVEELRAKIDDPNVDKRTQLEAAVELSCYPFDENGEPYVEFPTRLGNLIESYETYPNIKYGLDAVFFWYRLWVTLDKDLREEIDNAQAVADSTVYMVFTFFLAGALMLVYAATAILLHAGSLYLTWLQGIELPYVPEPHYLVGLALVFFVSGFLIYRLSLPTHAQFGELFKSVFDQYRLQLSFDDILKDVGRIVHEPNLKIIATQREKNWIVYRYLRWHRIRDEAAKKNFTVGDWLKR